MALKLKKKSMNRFNSFQLGLTGSIDCQVLLVKWTDAMTSSQFDWSNLAGPVWFSKHWCQLKTAWAQFFKDLNIDFSRAFIFLFQ